MVLIVQAARRGGKSLLSSSAINNVPSSKNQLNRRRPRRVVIVFWTQEYFLIKHTASTQPPQLPLSCGHTEKNESCATPPIQVVIYFADLLLRSACNHDIWRKLLGVPLSILPCKGRTHTRRRLREPHSCLRLDSTPDAGVSQNAVFFILFPTTKKHLHPLHLEQGESGFGLSTQPLGSKSALRGPYPENLHAFS